MLQVSAFRCLRSNHFIFSPLAGTSLLEAPEHHTTTGGNTPQAISVTGESSPTRRSEPTAPGNHTGTTKQDKGDAVVAARYSRGPAQTKERPPAGRGVRGGSLQGVLRPRRRQWPAAGAAGVSHRRRCRRRKPRGRSAKRPGALGEVRGIAERPLAADGRSELGRWEGELGHRAAEPLGGRRASQSHGAGRGDLVIGGAELLGGGHPRRALQQVHAAGSAARRVHSRRCRRGRRRHGESAPRMAEALTWQPRQRDGALAAHRVRRQRRGALLPIPARLGSGPPTSRTTPSYADGCPKAPTSTSVPSR